MSVASAGRGFSGSGLGLISALVGGCALATVLVFGAQASTAGYVHDDHPAVVDNPLAQSPPAMAQIWTSPWFGSDARFRTQGLSRPLVTLTYALESGAGFAAHGRHWVNLALYAVVAALLGGLVWLVLGPSTPWRPAAALVSSLLFVAHPVHASSVMCIAYRPELMGALCALAASCCFVVGLQRRTAIGWLSVPLLLLGLWSKESAITVLAAWVVYTLATRATRGWWYVSAALGVCAGWLALRHGWLGAPWVSGHDNPLREVGLTARWRGALWLIHFAGAKLWWPTNLAPDETFDALPVLNPPDSQVWLGGALLCLLTALVIGWVVAARRHQGAAAPCAAAVAWFGAAWLPVSHLIFPSTVLYADRLLFLPSVAALAALGCALVAATQRWPTARSVVVVVSLALAAQWTVLSRAEATHWKDELSLFAHGVRERPRSLRMRYNLGRLLLQSGRIARAVEQLEAAYDLDKGDEASWTLLVQAHTRAGACQRLHGLEAVAPSPARIRHQLALIDAQVACRRYEAAFQTGKGVPRLAGPWPMKVYVAAVAAGADDAQDWAKRWVTSPESSPQWVSAAVYADLQVGAAERALARLQTLSRSHPKNAHRQALRLCASAQPQPKGCERWVKLPSGAL